MIKVIKEPIRKSELSEIADEVFGDFVKAVVDIEQEIMAVGAELHADEEVMLTEEEGSKRADTWGVNIYPGRSEDEWVEFDSMVNLKPAQRNRSRNVEDPDVRERIKEIVSKLVIE
jgi:hypothetical protein